MKEKNDILNEAKIEVINKNQLGGQSVGTISTKISLSHEETGFYIEIEAYRSRIKTKELALMLFDLYLSEVYKL